MFIYSLSILFDQIAVMSPAEAVFMLIGLFSIIWLLAPLPDDRFRRITLQPYLFACWLGEQALIAAFWPFFLILNVALFGVDVLVKAGQLTVSSWDDVHFILVLPIVWWTVSVWRCSAHAGSRWFGAGARFATVCVFLEYALKLYIRSEYPRLFFACDELLLDYGSCF